MLPLAVELLDAAGKGRELVGEVGAGAGHGCDAKARQLFLHLVELEREPVEPWILLPFPFEVELLDTRRERPELLRGRRVSAGELGAQRSDVPGQLLQARIGLRRRRAQLLARPLESVREGVARNVPGAQPVLERLEPAGEGDVLVDGAAELLEALGGASATCPETSAGRSRASVATSCASVSTALRSSPSTASTSVPGCSAAARRIASSPSARPSSLDSSASIRGPSSGSSRRESSSSLSRRSSRDARRPSWAAAALSSRLVSASTSAAWGTAARRSTSSVSTRASLESTSSLPVGRACSSATALTQLVRAPRAARRSPRPRRRPRRVLAPLPRARRPGGALLVDRWPLRELLHRRPELLDAVLEVARVGRRRRRLGAKLGDARVQAGQVERQPGHARLEHAERLLDAARDAVEALRQRCDRRLQALRTRDGRLDPLRELGDAAVAALVGLVVSTR